MNIAVGFEQNIFYSSWVSMKGSEALKLIMMFLRKLGWERSSLPFFNEGMECKLYHDRELLPSIELNRADSCQ